MNSVIKQHPLYKLTKIAIIELIMSEYVHCDELPSSIPKEGDNIQESCAFKECKERNVKQRAEILALKEQLTTVRSQLSASESAFSSCVLPEGAFNIQLDEEDNAHFINIEPKIKTLEKENTNLKEINKSMDENYTILLTKNVKYKQMLCLLNELLLDTTA